MSQSKFVLVGDDWLPYIRFGVDTNKIKVILMECRGGECYVMVNPSGMSLNHPGYYSKKLAEDKYNRITDYTTVDELKRQKFSLVSITNRK